MYLWEFTIYKGIHSYHQPNWNENTFSNQIPHTWTAKDQPRKIVLKGMEYLRLIGYSSVCCFHSLGLYLLLKTKSDLPNQKLITTNLAVSEILVSAFKFSVDIVEFLGIKSETWSYCIVFFNIVFFTGFRLIVLHIVLDRFMDIYLNIMYPIYFKARTLKIIALSCWVLCLILALIGMLLIKFKIKTNTTRGPISSMILVTMDIGITFAATATYLYFYKKVRRISSSTAKVAPLKTRRRKISSKFKVPGLMVLSYILFNVSGSIMRLLGMYQVPLIFDMLGWASDGVIYVFMQRRVRRTLLRLFWKKSSAITVEDVPFSTVNTSNVKK